MALAQELMADGTAKPLGQRVALTAPSERSVELALDTAIVDMVVEPCVREHFVQLATAD